MLHSDMSALSAGSITVLAVTSITVSTRVFELTMQLFIAKISRAAASQSDKYTMNTKLYDIPDAENLAVIRAWVAEPLNRSSVITVGIEPHVRYQLAVYDQPWDETSIARVEAALGAMIQACAWPR